MGFSQLRPVREYPGTNNLRFHQLCFSSARYNLARTFTGISKVGNRYPREELVGSLPDRTAGARSCQLRSFDGRLDANGPVRAILDICLSRRWCWFGPSKIANRRSGKADVLEGVDLPDTLEDEGETGVKREADIAIGVVVSGLVCRIWQFQGGQRAGSLIEAKT